ncbi:MAG: histidine phosphatase family protein [Allorhizobium sp.]
MLIYMIRHGQTDWNAEGRLQGQKDIDLNALGRSQADRNGRHMVEQLGDRVDDFDFVASPLSRTRETMERLRAAMALDPTNYRTDERLVEICFGDWEGFTIAQMRKLSAGKVEARSIGKWHFIPPGDLAESYEILSWRVGSWLQSVDRPTVCVSHGGVLRSVFRLVGEMEPDDAANLNIPQDRILRVDTVTKQLDWL